jgi:hypothetical protein
MPPSKFGHGAAVYKTDPQSFMHTEDGVRQLLTDMSEGTFITENAVEAWKKYIQKLGTMTRRVVLPNGY